jgi:putative polyhydroxyalkanoate system protein
MSDINFVRTHSLPIAKAKARVQKAADGLAVEYDLSNEWDGNTLRFHRAGLDGQIYVTESDIQLDVTLGFLLKLFEEKLSNQIESNFRKFFGPELKARSKKPKKKAVS